MKKWIPSDDTIRSEYFMKNYAAGYAEIFIQVDVKHILEAAKEGSITEQQKQLSLNRICPGWTDEEIDAFINDEYCGREINIHTDPKYFPDGFDEFDEWSVRLQKDSPDIWNKYFTEGKELYIKFKDKKERYEKTQNKIVDYATQIHLLEDKEIKEKYYYGMVIMTARCMKKFGKNYFPVAHWMNWCPLDLDERLVIADILDKAIFDSYEKHDGSCFMGEKDREKEKIKKERGKVGEQFIRLLDTVKELIYRMYISGNANLFKVEELLKDVEEPFEVLKNTEKALREYISTMNEVMDSGIYPAEVILQMLGYPEMSREEYDRRVNVMQKDVCLLRKAFDEKSLA